MVKKTDILKKLNPSSITFLLFFLSSSICPGFLYFYLYHREFFLSTDLAKLILLAVSISLPVYIINCISGTLLATGVHKDMGQNERMEMGAIYGGAQTLVIFNLVFIANYNEKTFTPTNFLEIFIWVQVITFVIYSGIGVFFIGKEKRAKKRLDSS